MQTVQGPVLQSLRAVESFLDTHADKLVDVQKTGARRRLAELIAQLTGHLSDQWGSQLEGKGATQKHRSLRRVLIREHMAPIARIARAELPPVPEVEPLRMPKGKPTAERLGQLAYGMAKAAAPFAADFTHAGMPEDFIKQLTDAADEMLNALTDRTKSKGRRGGATRGLKSGLTAGRRVVHVLDSFVSAALKNDPALLREWNLIKRVPKPMGRNFGPLGSSSSTHAPSSSTTPAAATMQPEVEHASTTVVTTEHAPSLAPTTLVPAGVEHEMVMEHETATDPAQATQS
jgi:hypothetical protein